MDVMAALATGQKQPFVIDRLSLEGPRDTEVLIELTAAGLCHTDLMLVDGSRDWSDYPIVLGHEGAGIVRECGTGVKHLRPGDKVIPVTIPECGVCPACRDPRTNLCDEYFKPWPRRPFSRDGRPVTSFLNLGTFSRFLVTRAVQVVKIRTDAPLDQVCCMGCAGITGLGAALFTARMEAGASAAVFGLGGIGLNVVEGARIAGATTIIGVDPSNSKEAPARLAGITHFVNPSQPGVNVVEQIKEITGGGADYSFECVGHPGVLRQAVDCTRVGWGTVVMIGVMPGSGEFTLPARAIQQGRRLMGSFLGNVKTHSHLPEFVDWFVDGKISRDNLISHRITLDKINEGFALMTSGEARRVVIDFQ